MDEYPGTEKREFFRYQHEKPVNYKVVTSSRDKQSASRLIAASSKNISASGILFTSEFVPELSSIVVIDLDYHTTKICQEIEERALIVNNKLIGKVVRIEEDDDGLYNIGVAFIKKAEPLPEELKALVA